MDKLSIARRLEEENLGGLLDRFEIEAIEAEAETIRRMLPKPPRKFLPRVVGAAAMLMGAGGIILGLTMPEARRYSPFGIGAVALILGIILIIRPSASGSDV